MPTHFVVPALTRRYAPPSPGGRGTRSSTLSRWATAPTEEGSFGVLMSDESPRYRYISNSPDYRHLDDKERYKALYEEVGTVEANRLIRWREEWMKYFRPRQGASILELGA